LDKYSPTNPFLKRGVTMSILYQSDLFSINDDPQLLDLTTIHQFLAQDSYWAQNRTMEQVIQSIKHSYCLGAYFPAGDLVGFARIVTDWTTFAWICDVFVLKQARGLGIGKQLVACMVEHPDLKNIRRLMLATRDAHLLYQQFGFVVEDNPNSIMKRFKP
jgi:GNAT superfamily N-acetyltransferase